MNGTLPRRIWAGFVRLVLVVTNYLINFVCAVGALCLLLVLVIFFPDLLNYDLGEGQRTAPPSA